MAIKSALSQKVLDGDLIVVDTLKFDSPKTKEFANVLKNLKVASKTLIALEAGNEQAALSARNLANVTVVPATGVNVLDVVNSDKLILTQAALSKIEEVLA